MKILIAGCGYIGLPLGITLKSRGDQVSGWVFSERSVKAVTEAGLEVIQSDLTDALAWKDFQQHFDAIIYCPSTRGGAPEDYRRIYVEGMKNAVGALKPGGRFLYTASTSVYGQNDGSLVDEASLTEPGSETGKILLEAEGVALSVRGTVLRLSAIYGPGRGVMVKRFLDASGPVPGKPDRYLNQIHREDAVSAIVFALDQEQTPGQILNVSDNQPATHGGIYRWLADMTGKPMPEFRSEAVAGKRGDSNRRISNEKIRALGWSPKYGSFKEGYSLLINADSSLR